VEDHVPLDRTNMDGIQSRSASSPRYYGRVYRGVLCHASRVNVLLCDDKTLTKNVVLFDANMRKTLTKNVVLFDANMRKTL